MQLINFLLRAIGVFVVIFMVLWITVTCWWIILIAISLWIAFKIGNDRNPPNNTIHL